MAITPTPTLASANELPERDYVLVTCKPAGTGRFCAIVRSEHPNEFFSFTYRGSTLPGRFTRSKLASFIGEPQRSTRADSSMQRDHRATA